MSVCLLNICKIASCAIERALVLGLQGLSNLCAENWHHGWGFFDRPELDPAYPAWSGFGWIETASMLTRRGE